jgi:hypothetical protein
MAQPVLLAKQVQLAPVLQARQVLPDLLAQLVRPVKPGPQGLSDLAALLV